MMRTALFTALIILFTGLLSYIVNLPEDIGMDVPDGKLNSLSFAPFREGQSPLLLQFPTPQQIEDDMKLMAGKTHTIRTYSSSQGMKVIPELARKHGLKLIQGGWIGYLDADNRAEVEALVKAANDYPDVIKRVIVGNEVLLRGERTPQALVEYIREVKKRVKQPVSYADVWSMYMKYPDLIKEVDFITIHILPYWEDEPISVKDAPAHIERIYKQVKKEADSIAPGKSILIGESGWPAEGKQRGWAVPSVVNEAYFTRGLLKVAADNGFDVNIVEAFNQSWKSELEGVVGANWGLFTVDRKEVFPLTGKVYENINWFKHIVWAAVFMVILVSCHSSRLANLSTGRLFLFLGFLQVLATVFVWQSALAWNTSFDGWQRFKTLLGVVLNGSIGVLVSYRAMGLLRGEHHFKAADVLGKAIMLVVVIALYKTYLLAVEGRYISFPFEITLLSVLSLLGLWWAYSLNQGRLLLSDLNFNRLIGSPQANPQRHSQLGRVVFVFVIGLLLSKFMLYFMAKETIGAFPETGDRILQALRLTATPVLLSLSVFLLALGIVFKVSPYTKPLSGLLMMVMVGLTIGEPQSFWVARDFILAYPGVAERLKWALTFTFTNGQLVAWLGCLAVFAVALFES